jgi:hypothetical protein
MTQWWYNNYFDAPLRKLHLYAPNRCHHNSGTRVVAVFMRFPSRNWRVPVKNSSWDENFMLRQVNSIWKFHLFQPFKTCLKR